MKSIRGATPGHNPAAAAGKKMPPAGLQQFALGPRVKIITARDAAPDEQSLLDFARSQGIDDALLRLISHDGGDTAQGGDPAPAASTASDLTGLMPMNAAGSTLTGGPGTQSTALPATQPRALQTTLQTTPAGFVPTHTPAACALNSAQTPPDPRDTAEAHAPDALQPAPPATTAGLVPTNAPAAFALNSAQTPPDPRDTAEAHAPDALQPAPPATTAGFVPTSAPAAFTAAGKPSDPQAAVTPPAPPATTTAAASRRSAAANTRVAVAPADPAPMADGDTDSAPALTQPAPEQTVSAALSANFASGDPQHNGDHARELDLGAIAPSGEAQLQDDHFRRSEQYQVLSDRFAEAVGQRLTAQIARGQMQVDLQLNPAHLGKINVRLRVQDSGTLEAEFSATRKHTEDLLVNGLPRLREVFAESGIGVSRMNVARDGASSNPGHQHQARQPAPAQPAVRTTPAEPAPAAAARGEYVGSDGLDVTV